ncbi:NtaA/DmoA family FMN-dependent monooxygenase [Rummeliibacillus sp. SL167]|uniref:NtaA/DmoA family FMN-dependent monooxygenase n=1 Tax=Rummeliibacillus sp. SL167 TaxID=2579792 RepID=UPI0011B844E1|nr:NtaA/DmoA family FMN-dependent monooxygenase [Rummeliibacillus sp. SL167]
MKRIYWNAFEMNCVGHINHGLWKIPGNKRAHYKNLEYWTDLAKTLEKGRFDALFLADVVGLYDVYKGGLDTSIKEAVQIPANDPFIPISAMAHVTSNLSFAVTFSTSYEHPYGFARRMSTLDHLTNGRIAWNIVTSHLESADKNFEVKQYLDHDEKYDLAEEFLEVCYKLWELSWDNDAVSLENNDCYASPSKVHKINHKGKYFNVPGPHICEPSPQRTPVIYQAGMSERGRYFAAKNAECIFLGGKDIDTIKWFIKDIKNKAFSLGRSQNEIKFFMGLCIITGLTDDAIREKIELYKAFWSVEGNLAHYCGGQNLDLSKYEKEDILNGSKVTDILDNLRKIDGKWFRVITGKPVEVVNQIQSIIEETDIDGFNLVQFHSPHTFEDFINYIVPELQNRELYQKDYSPGTYREKLFYGKHEYKFNNFYYNPPKDI